MADLSFNVGGNNEELIKRAEQICASIRAIALESEKASNVSSGFAKVLKSTFDVIGGTEALKKFVSDVVRVRGEFQQLEVSFATLLQSKEKSNALMSQIIKTAAETPFDVKELAASTKQLIEYGVASEQINETLLRLGDIASSVGIPLEQLTSLYGTVMTQGTLSGEDLSQFATSGISMLQGLADMLGVSTEKVNEMVDAGKIGFPEVQKVIENLTNEGGRFYGSMDEQSNTIVGEMNNLRDAWDAMLNKIGQSQEDVISDSIGGVTSLVENYEQIGKILLSLIEIYGVYKAACLAHIVLTQSLGTTQLMLGAGMSKLKQSFLNFTGAMNLNPWVLAATAIIGLGVAMWNLSEHTTAAQKAQKRFNDEQSKFDQQQQDRKQKIDGLISTIQDETETEYAKAGAYEQLQKLSPILTDAYNRQEIASLDLSKSEKALNEERDQMEYDNVVSKINSITESLKLLNAENGKVLGTSSAGVVTVNNNAAIQQNEEELKNYKQQLDEYKRLKKEAEENDMPIEKRIQIATDNLDKIKEEYNKINTLMLAERAKADKNPLYTIPLKLQLEFEGLDRQLKEAQSKVAGLDKQQAKGTTYQQDLADARKGWQTARKEYQALLNNKEATSFEVTTAKTTLDEKEKDYKDLGGVTTDSGDDNRADKIRDQQRFLNDLIDSQARELIRATEDQWNGIWEMKINTMDEGHRKTLKQMEYNHAMELQTIDRAKEDLRRKNREKAEAEFNARENLAKAKNPKYKKKTFDGSSITLSEIENQHFREMNNIALTKQANDITNYYKSILDKYQDFTSQRISVEKQYNDDIAYLQSKRTKENSEEVDRAIQLAQEKMEDTKQQINNAEVQKMEGSNGFLKKLYGDYSQMKFDDLQNLLKEAKQLQSYLSGDSNADGLKFITKEQLALIKESPTGLANLKGALDKLLKGGKTNQWDNVFDNFSKGLAKLNKSKDIKDVSEAMQDIGGAASEASSMLSGVASDLSQMFEEMGNTGAADAMSGVQEAMNSISNIGQGFAKGGIVGGIAAAVGEAANFIGKAFAANARHKEALKEIMNETTAQQRAYNLLLLEQNLLYEKGTTMFGVDNYGKAKNAVNVMKDAVSDLNEELKGSGKYDGGYEYSFGGKGGFRRVDSLSQAQREVYNSNAGLADIQIKTGHKKTGMFGWGKGKDTYSSVLSVYPELIDQNGKFNTSLAETIINTRTMSDDNKSAFQNMINLSKQAEEALQAVKDYLSDIFGDLGNMMSDALVDAFKNGSDAAQAFTDSVSNMLEQLAQQMVYSVTLAPVIEKAQGQMMDVMQNVGLSDEEKFKQWTNILGDFVDDAVGEQNNANLLYEELKKIAAEKGFNIFEAEESSSQESTQKGFATMSQEAGDELNGRFTALQMSNEEIKNSMIFVLGNLSSLCTTAFDRNILLTEMRNLALMSNGHLEDIAKYTKPLLGFGEKLDKIEQNTNNL